MMYAESMVCPLSCIGPAAAASNGALFSFLLLHCIVFRPEVEEKKAGKTIRDHVLSLKLS
jgi:hypothetical protein